MRKLVLALMLSVAGESAYAQSGPVCEVDPDRPTRHGVGENNRRVCDMRVRCRFGGEEFYQNALCFEVRNRCPDASACLNNDVRDAAGSEELPLPGSRAPKQGPATNNDAMFY